jgi:predicted kinase
METRLSTSKKLLICTVGFPRSGKTTWARAQGHPIVCPDAIRLALHGQRFFAPAEPMVWAQAKVMVRALFGAGHDVVILDACNSSRKRRDDWISNEWETVFKVIREPALTCINRAMAENDQEIIPSIERMANNYDPLEEDELQWSES